MISNTVQDNRASTTGIGWGGGIYLSQIRSVTITENLVTSNTATLSPDASTEGWGGGIMADRSKLISNTVAGNTASNAGDGGGGGFFLEVISRTVLADNICRENTASIVGKGIGWRHAGEDP